MEHFKEPNHELFLNLAAFSVYGLDLDKGIKLNLIYSIRPFSWLSDNILLFFPINEDHK